jgi:hypothetical protein
MYLGRIEASSGLMLLSRRLHYYLRRCAALELELRANKPTEMQIKCHRAVCRDVEICTSITADWINYVKIRHLHAQAANNTNKRGFSGRPPLQT